ncbi:PI-PLC X domain-containing protein 1 isoform X1 [Mastacembelus armatus]|uniref:PI-PLC X domain-containing protein 1 isoform X1 n=1 Tax=Mastacembelus armatus TaxID=205130 RepID=UPI000E456AD3|nr:PI-PLC X domain-containing protein 1-like isoform X1 [Mastacembelus armatus]
MDHSCQDWMSALPEELWDIPLTNLAIPGSHDAMSYCLDINSPLVRSESNFLRLLDGLFYCFTRPIIFKWATTQDKSIEEQLSMGIRYFDLRIAHKPNDSSNDLYFTHVIYTHLTVLETLLSVNTWLESHPKEVVILACSHFEGMDVTCHESFIFCLKKLFGSKLCPREVSFLSAANLLKKKKEKRKKRCCALTHLTCSSQESVLTLRHLWASGYQVILSYESQTAATHQELWPDIPYLWANQQTAQGVISYLDRQKDLGRPEGFFVAGLNLTAGRSYITMNPKQSLQTLTFSNWECLKEWVEEQIPGSDPKSINIIAGDFVGPLPLCSLVIALNQKLVQKQSSQIKADIIS